MSLYPSIRLLNMFIDRLICKLRDRIIFDNKYYSHVGVSYVTLTNYMNICL